MATQKRRREYQVIVGNVGIVYTGASSRDALTWFKTYCEHSRAPFGSRVCGEPVTVTRDGEIWREYAGTLPAKD